MSLHWCLCFCFGRHLAFNVESSTKKPSRNISTSTFNILIWIHCRSHLSVSAIRLMEKNPANQLRPGGLSTIIYYLRRGCLGFLNHQQYESHVPCKSSTTMHVPTCLCAMERRFIRLLLGEWWIHWQNSRYDAGFQINLFNLFIYKPNIPPGKDRWR